MKRKIIVIDETKCNGCGLCATACHEQAIAMVAGKATLLRDDYCDGLGDCLPTCPTGAIAFEERDAAAYDAAAVAENQKAAQEGGSQLRQWPVQLKLVPAQAPYFNGAHLLLAADCAAYAHGSFHTTFLQGRVLLIGCPKLDGVDYSEKLTEILRQNDVRSVTVLRMEVPCCGGLEHAAKTALQQSGKMIPWQVTVLSTQGVILQ